MKMAVSVKNSIKNGEVLAAHIGVFDSEILGDLFLSVEAVLLKNEERYVALKRVYSLFIESVQNVYHHTANLCVEANLGADPCFFLVKLYNNHYQIITGNAIDNNAVGTVKKKIQEVNEINRETLTNLYRKTLNNGIVSEKGGSGLGFIDMKRKSRSNIHYEFKPISDKFSYFILKLTIK